MKIKKTYSFAFWSSIYISFFSSIALVVSARYLLHFKIELLYLLAYIVSIFIFSFIIIQFRVEKFIYQRIKKIYDDVSILDKSDLSKTSITSDIDTLSREVQKFAQTKQQQIKNLNQRENYRREFLGNISHELKTPLFTVQGYLLTLTDGAVEDKKITLRYLKRANKGVDRLISIVKDLDLISKLETENSTLKKQSFDIVKLTQEIFDMLEIKSKKRNITLCFDKKYFPIMVIADTEKIEQVLINLIVNSIKYGKVNGTTMVSFSSKEKDKLLIKVADNGEGIEREHLGRLFQRFYRVDKSRAREQGGSGLGLSIVKHIVEAHGEEIFVESKTQKGSVFSFTLEKTEKI